MYMKLIGVFFFLTFMCIPFVAKESTVKIDTPYGIKAISDEDTKFLMWLSYSTGDYRIDSINTRILSNLCNIADGALSEALGNVCMTDFVNKKNIIIDIYKNNGKDVLIDYLREISIELYLQQETTNCKPDMYAVFCSNFSNDLNSNDSIYIFEILNFIKQEYNYCFDK